MPGRGPRPRTLALGLGTALIALAAGAFVLPSRRPPSLPELFTVPPFALTERSGRIVTRDDLRGAPWVADFIFTRCAGACPAMSARMARLGAELPASVRRVSITVDPAFDTHHVLDAYARRYGAGGSWLFLTGTQRELHALAIQGFKLAAAELPPGEEGPDGPFLHSSKFVLVDRDAVIRGYYDSADEGELQRLLRDARILDTRP
jgi:protein SCO1/2